MPRQLWSTIKNLPDFFPHYFLGVKAYTKKPIRGSKTIQYGFATPNRILFLNNKVFEITVPMTLYFYIYNQTNTPEG
jgi:hypothetical protein